MKPSEARLASLLETARTCRPDVTDLGGSLEQRVMEALAGRSPAPRSPPPGDRPLEWWALRAVPAALATCLVAVAVASFGRSTTDLTYAQATEIALSLRPGRCAVAPE